AVIAPKRLDVAPDVPTLAEVGFPDLTVGSWQGIYVPKGTSRDIVAKLYTAVTKAMQGPEVESRLAKASAAVVLSKSPEDFRAFWENESNRWSKVVRDIGAVAQK
ncbi:MAG TPA: tripartite tricarboxylate transporter substrate-binding protein, partial [Burkholderiales bacterium]